jgi:hypothetical protein
MVRRSVEVIACRFSPTAKVAKLTSSACRHLLRSYDVAVTHLESIHSNSVPSTALRPLLMLWTAPPPAHRCHGCGRC